MENSLILFVKAPVPGNVKTRLVPPLTRDEAAELYRGWVKDLCRTVLTLKGVSLRIAYEPHPLFPDVSWTGQTEIPFFAQTGDDLGQKMRRAFEIAFKSGAQRAVIIGSDSPGLPASLIEDSFRALGSNRLVLGPAQDGGYYLIGFQGRAVPEVFDNVAWSTSQVLGQTLENAKKCNLSLQILPEYFDVDLPEDLTKISRGKP